MTPEQKLVMESLEESDQVAFEEDGSIVVTLSEPVELAGEAIDKVTFKRGNGRMLEAMDSARGDMRKNFALCSAASGQPEKVFRDMAECDVMLCVSAVGSFLFTPRKRGKSSSPSSQAPSAGTRPSS